MHHPQINKKYGEKLVNCPYLFNLLFLPKMFGHAHISSSFQTLCIGAKAALCSLLPLLNLSLPSGYSKHIYLPGNIRYPLCFFPFQPALTSKVKRRLKAFTVWPNCYCKWYHQPSLVFNVGEPLALHPQQVLPSSSS